MVGLAQTVSALAARRRAVEAADPSSRTLREVSDFGPNPGELRMLLHAPDSLQDAAGLVVVLHGCTQTAEGYAEGAGWLALADRYGFAVLCPEQRRANNMNLCFDWFQPGDIARDQGEAASIRAMVRRAVVELRIDPARVFVTGLSAGGAMANVMLATYPEVFAAGAILAGLPYGSASTMQQAFAAMSGQVRLSGREWGDKVRQASTHRGPWPRVSVWQGEQDHTVADSVADEVVAQWRDVHDAHGPLDGRDSVAGRRHSEWRTAGGEAVVELHRIAGMGHGAPLSCSGPEACGAAGAYLLDVGVSSSLELARTWGLANGAGAELAVSRPRPDRAPPPPLARPAQGDGRLDVGAVINKALRDAGLLR